MTAALNVDNTFVIHLRTHKTAALRHKSKGSKHIYLSHGLCRPLNPKNLGCDCLPKLYKEAVFQGGKLFLRAQDGVLQLLKLRRNVALRIGQGLLAHIVIRHHILVGISHLQVIAEYLVEFDSQVLDACLFPLLCLHLCQPALALRLGLPIAVHVLVAAVPDNIAVPDGNRRVLPDGPGNHSLEIGQHIQFLTERPKKRGLKISHQRFDMRQHFQGRAKGGQISGICRLVADAPDEALQIVNGIEILSKLLPGDGVSIQLRYCLMAALNLPPVNQGLFHHCPQSSGAHSGFGFVENPQKGASFLLFPQGFHQLKISSRGAVKEHISAGEIRI